MFKWLRAWLLSPVIAMLEEILQEVVAVKTANNIGPTYIDASVEADYHNSKTTEHCYICGKEVRTYRRYHFGLVSCFDCLNRNK